MPRTPRPEQPPQSQDEMLQTRREVYRELGEGATTVQVASPSSGRRTRNLAEQLGINVHEWGNVSVEPVSAEPMADDDMFGDMECDDEPMREPVLASDFPAFDIPRWESTDEREGAANSWFRQMEYRLRWIFYREEREGVNRLRYTPAFNPDDFKKRAEKVGKPHPMNTETSQYYDWNLGGTDFIIRLESFNIKETPVIRCHYVYKSNGLELSYEDRIWDGQYYRECNQVWANT